MRLVTTADDKITSIELTHQDALKDLQDELQKYKGNNQRWQQLLNQWTQEKEQLLADKLRSLIKACN